MKLWVDKDRFIPLREEMYAKSGTLLKRIELSDIELINGRWYPKRMLFKDMLKEGLGTEFVVEDIQFNVPIPDYIFSKASLKK
jgi:outer membrane lipoprotein-sorting protein